MKISRMVLLPAMCLALAFAPAFAGGEAARAGYGGLVADLVSAAVNPSEEALAAIEADLEGTDDIVARLVAETWKKVWLDPGYRLYMFGADDPAELPVTGKHAFVVLGYALENGEMTDELIGRCSAAAAAWKAFPESIIVCTGGATGGNNPEGHTEAGLMKAWLVDNGGIAPEKIFTDERAKTTEENARNTLAILKEQGVETMTVVTSSYHQKRGVTLYAAMAARYRQEYGYTVEIIGNFCYPVENGAHLERREMSSTVYQLCSLLGMDAQQMSMVYGVLR